MEGDLHIQMIQNGPNRAKEQSPTRVERRADPSESQIVPITDTYYKIWIVTLYFILS